MRGKIITSLIALVFIAVFGLMASQTEAETMNFKLVSMVEKLEMVNVTGLEGATIGVMDRKGLAMFDNGDIATTACRGIFDTKKGFQGYSSLTFDDGSTLVLSWKGPTSRVPAGGKYGGFTADFEYANGTGRFAGIKGAGSFKEVKPLWDEDFKAKGFTYYEFTGEYNK